MFFYQHTEVKGTAQIYGRKSIRTKFHVLVFRIDVTVLLQYVQSVLSSLFELQTFRHKGHWLVITTCPDIIY